MSSLHSVSILELGLKIQLFEANIIRELQVIVQLCQWIEDGKTQCTEYFPKQEDEWKDYGAIRVKVTEKTAAMSQLRKVYRTKIRAVYKDRKHEVLAVLNILKKTVDTHGLPSLDHLNARVFGVEL